MIIKSFKRGSVALIAALTMVNCLPATTDLVEKINKTGLVEVDPMIAMYNMFGGGNPTKTPAGELIAEGDIVVPMDQQVQLEQGLSLRKATPDGGVYWPNGEVVYMFHESLTANERAIIEAAMQHWSKHTCITFRYKQPSDYLFVRFRSDLQGCWSLVGRQMDRNGQGQEVSIGQGCANLNVVVHEIGHVIGFFHEQSRSDRDSFIEIVWPNVLPGFALQFRKETDANHNIPYDLTSTMQYPQWAFSKALFEKSTIVAKNPAYQRFLSKSYPLSFRDRQLANEMYSCTTKCAGGQCQNGGYLRATAAEGGALGASGQCSCDCPPNFTGANCETSLRPDYYKELPCGGLITKAGRIETPGYPERQAPEMSCMWDIRAPAGHRVSVRMEGFGFAPRFTKAGTQVINKCFNETVEIRLKNADIYDGDVYCGNDIAPGTLFKSDGPRAVIIINANDRMVGTGLRARVSFPAMGSAVDEEDEGTEEASTTAPPKPRVTSPRPPIEDVTSQTLPPVVPVYSTISSLLEEYEKESKRTLPPVFPF